MATWHCTCMEPDLHGRMAAHLHGSLTCMATWHRTCKPYASKPYATRSIAVSFTITFDNLQQAHP